MIIVTIIIIIMHANANFFLFTFFARSFIYFFVIVFVCSLCLVDRRLLLLCLHQTPTYRSRTEKKSCNIYEFLLKSNGHFLPYQCQQKNDVVFCWWLLLFYHEIRSMIRHSMPPPDYLIVIWGTSQSIAYYYYINLNVQWWKWQ